MVCLARPLRLAAGRTWRRAALRCRSHVPPARLAQVFDDSGGDGSDGGGAGGEGGFEDVDFEWIDGDEA